MPAHPWWVLASARLRRLKLGVLERLIANTFAIGVLGEAGAVVLLIAVIYAGVITRGGTAWE